MKDFITAFAFIAGRLVLTPFLIWARLPMDEFSSFTAPSQILSLIPGLTGVLLRRIWYEQMLRRCGKNLTVDWLGVVRTRDSMIGDRCTIGVSSWIGWVEMGNDVMTGSNVVILSGARQHSYSNLNEPMRNQRGEKKRIKVGSDVWIGAQSIIMSDINEGTVVGAGSVVTRSYPSYSIIVGNPARFLKSRYSG